MAEKKIFVGRKDELKQFEKVLADPRGQAVLVVGQAGMGKTWLVNKMAEMADSHPKCGSIRYEVTSRDSVDVLMERMMNDAFNAGKVVEGSFDNTARRRQQWYTLLETVVPKGEKLSKLIQSFKREEQRPTREQFLERLRLISAKMKDEGRSIFIIDPLEYLDEKNENKCAEEWAIVVRDLPDKVKFVFAQRPEDGLAFYRKFARLEKVERIPDNELGSLDKKAVNELLNFRAGETNYIKSELYKGLEKYKGHPYALQGALDLLAEGKRLEDLPDDPTERGIVEEQWDKICSYREDAIRLFKAYAILEVAVPDDIVERVGEIGADRHLTLIGKNIYLGKLLHTEDKSKGIYHLLLAQYILGKIGDAEEKEYHGRAVEVYREKLRKAKKKQTRPDALAAMRLAEHVLAVEGKEAFVDAFVNECTRPLLNLGLLDAAMNFSGRALGLVEKGSEEEAMISGNLGVIYLTRGELYKAEEMHKKALEIAEKFDWREAMASAYDNLGVIYLKKGELDKAEEMHKKALEIDIKIGRIEGMANQYGNLGLVYQTRGELDKAEEMHKKSLDIAEKLGLLEGMTHQYGNLGVIYLKKREFGKAEEMYKKSLEMAEKLGLLEVMATIHVGLGVIYLKKGESDKAEEMHNKSLEIDIKIGRIEGMANEYGNLGLIYKQRGDVGKAREYWEKALDLYKKIGMPHMVEKVQGWIKEIDY